HFLAFKMSAEQEARLQRIKSALVDYPDFPKPGIVFKDIMGILASPSIFADTIDSMVDIAKGLPQVDLVVGLESRGFLFGPCIAQRLGVGFAPIRKAGKLPGRVESESYTKEYGQDRFEIQANAVPPGAQVMLVDDLVALGGTMAAAVRLIQRVGGNVTGCLVVVELSFLNGRARLPEGTLLKSLVCIDSE
ncbi:hypothetical protein BOX15_Mlig003889g2, partial [Macrostomum lignano]